VKKAPHRSVRLSSGCHGKFSCYQRIGIETLSAFAAAKHGTVCVILGRPPAGALSRKCNADRGKHRQM
jgi:hypothetical protein